MWANRLGHDINNAKKGPTTRGRRDTIPGYMMTRRSALAAFAGVLVGPSLAPLGPEGNRVRTDRRSLPQLRLHPRGPGRTIQKEMGISIDFSDETKLLNTETLDGYKLLIVLRDGMIWPEGYPDENTNAAWVATGRPPLTFDPPTPSDESEAGILDHAGAGQSGPRLRGQGRLGAVPAQRDARRLDRSRFSSRARRRPTRDTRPSARSR